jgi:hypothetical protein
METIMKKLIFSLSILMVMLLGSLTSYQLIKKPSLSISKLKIQDSPSTKPEAKQTILNIDPKLSSIINSSHIYIQQVCDSKPRIEVAPTLLDKLDLDKLKQGIIHKNQGIDLENKAEIIKIFTAKPLTSITNYGVANSEINCPAQQLKIFSSGAGSIKISNSQILDSIVIESTGMGNITAGDVNHININAKGMGDIQLGMVKQAEIKIYGSSKISFSNAPDVISNIYGTGQIINGAKY